MSDFVLTIAGHDTYTGVLGLPVPEPQPESDLYRFLHDGETSVFTPRNGDPEVYWLSDRGFEFTEAMQRLAYELFLYGAPSLPEEIRGSRWSSIYANRKAFCNKSGFGDTELPRKNYILGENVNNPNAANPDFDKVRVCGGMTGKAKEIQKGYRWLNYVTKKHEIVDFVWFETIHPDNLPTIDELIKQPWLSFCATTSYARRAGRFPNGVYEKLGIYEDTLVPFFSPVPVGWPLYLLEPVTTIADPYKFGG